MEKEKGVARAGLTEGPFLFRSDMEVDRDYRTEKGRIDLLMELIDRLIDRYTGRQNDSCF